MTKLSSSGGLQISIIHDDSIRDLLGLIPLVRFEEIYSSDNSVDIISFDNILLEKDIAHGMFFKVKNLQVFKNSHGTLILDINTLKNLEEVFNGM